MLQDRAPEQRRNRKAFFYGKRFTFHRCDLPILRFSHCLYVRKLLCGLPGSIRKVRRLLPNSRYPLCHHRQNGVTKISDFFLRINVFPIIHLQVQTIPFIAEQVKGQMI